MPVGRVDPWLNVTTFAKSSNRNCLTKSANGCPDGGVEWLSGTRTFDPEDSDAHNYFLFSGYNQYLAGLEPLCRIVENGGYELRIDLGDWDDINKFAKYTSFSISDESDNYTLAVSGYSGDAGDAFTYHNDNMFSTLDVDNDQSSYGSCSEWWRGGWWYNACYDSNLNGLYHVGGNTTVYWETVVWWQWHGSRYSLKTTEMKVRRK